MKIMHTSSRLARTAGMLAVASALLLAGCDTDEFIEVTDPDTVNPETLQDPALLNIVVAGAIGEFTQGYSGSGGDSYLSVSALLGDEFTSTGTFTTRTATDRRLQQGIQNGNTSDGAYFNLQQARRATKDAADLVAQFESTSDNRWVRLKALEGYAIIPLAEGYCSNIPLSNVAEDGSFEFGQPLTTDQLLSEAITRFDAAIGGGGPFADLARIGKGRALVNQGQYAAAASAVASVATDVVFHIDHSVNGASNPIFSLQSNGRYAVSDMEGGNQTGMDYRSANDPRVQWFEDPAGGFDAQFQLFVSEKYSGFAAPVALATGVEARLIEAEAALNANQPAQMIGILNDLRAEVVDLMTGIQPDYQVDENDAALDPLVDPGNQTAREDMLFRERAFWLFLTGHRLGDLRRLVRDYGRNQVDVYPSGAYHKGDEHGPDVVFQMDFDETNNPNWDRNLCSVTSAN
ncbi:MAG: hypothetical protein RQ751_11060 [Longimicrobiales bacterium]|nr:hypothetical protein [Longimicrobiales bacterium]